MPYAMGLYGVVGYIIHTILNIPFGLIILLGCLAIAIAIVIGPKRHEQQQIEEENINHQGIRRELD